MKFENLSKISSFEALGSSFPEWATAHEDKRTERETKKMGIFQRFSAEKN